MNSTYKSGVNFQTIEHHAIAAHSFILVNQQNENELVLLLWVVNFIWLKCVKLILLLLVYLLLLESVLLHTKATQLLKLFQQVYWYHKLRKAFFYILLQHSELTVKFKKLFSNKAYQNLYFMVIYFIN